MLKIRILIKIALFILLYALCYYFLPLPQLAFFGFLFPIAYLYADMNQVKYIQTQYMIGFSGGVLLSIILIKLSIVSFYFGFIAMSLIFNVCFYFSCFTTWMKPILIILSIFVCMIFNIVVDGTINLAPPIFEKFILSIFLSVFLYAMIDKLIGKPHYNYFPKDLHKHIVNLHKMCAKYFLRIEWHNIRHTLCTYLAILSLLAAQQLFGLSGSECAIASGSIIIVLGSDHETTKINILLRAVGALLGISIACLQLMVLVVLPFLFMQISLLLVVTLIFSFFILTYKQAAKLLPQAAVTYLIVVIAGIQAEQLNGALLRLFGIILGAIIAYLVSIFFFAIPSKQ